MPHHFFGQQLLGPNYVNLPFAENISQVEFCKSRRLIPDCCFDDFIKRNLIKECPGRRQCPSDCFTCESHFIYSYFFLWDSQILYMQVPGLPKYSRKLFQNMLQTHGFIMGLNEFQSCESLGLNRIK